MTELKYVSLGAHPSDEDGADPCLDGIGYPARALNECEALIAQLLRIVGPPPDDVTAFMVCRSRNPERFIVGLLYDPESPLSRRYAERCRRETEGGPVKGARMIDPAQVGFWDSLGGRPLGPDEVEAHGIEYLSSLDRLRDVRRQYPCPTVIDVGNGIFGAGVGLLFVDDDTGRAIAYAPPELIRQAAQSKRDDVDGTSSAAAR